MNSAEKETKIPEKTAKKSEGSMYWKTIGGNNPDTIGGNSHVYMYDDGKGNTDAVMVDMGSLFCDEDKTGYASVVPDARKYLDKADGSEKAEMPISGLLITHGHEDHIGGLAHLAKMGYKLPTIYGTPLTIEFVKKSLSTNQVPKDAWPELDVKKPGEKIKLGKFDIEPVAVTHSIPDAAGFFIKTPAGSAFHTGDMKTDTSIKIGKPFDKKRIEELSKEGIDAMMVDSTSVMREGKIPPEADIEKEITAIAKKHPKQRLVIPIISSSTQRLASAAKAALETGRTIAMEGSSVIASERCLRKAGYDMSEIVGGDVRIMNGASKTAGQLPDGEKIVIATGTQGEEVASFPKAVNGEYTPFEKKEDGKTRGREFPFVIGKNDVIIMAQTPIPGNEKAHFAVLEKAAKAGATVYVAKLPEDKEQAKLFTKANIHASGHGAKGDIQEAQKAATKHKKHTVIVPVHGSKEHLEANAKAAEELGLKASLHQNYEALKISPKGVEPVTVEMEKGKLVEKPSDGKAVESHWIGAKSATGDWRKPFFDYDLIDKDLKKVENIYKDPGWKARKKAKEERDAKKGDDKKTPQPKHGKKMDKILKNKESYRLRKEEQKKTQQVLVKKHWRDMDR